jgi:hypothetical protein
MYLIVPFHVREKLWKKGFKPFSTQEVGDGPKLLQGFNYRLITGRALPSDSLWDIDISIKRPYHVLPAIERGFNDNSDDPALLGLPGAFILLAVGLDEFCFGMLVHDVLLLYEKHIGISVTFLSDATKRFR